MAYSIDDFEISYNSVYLKDSYDNKTVGICNFELIRKIYREIKDRR